MTDVTLASEDTTSDFTVVVVALVNLDIDDPEY